MPLPKHLPLVEFVRNFLGADHSAGDTRAPDDPFRGASVSAPLPARGNAGRTGASLGGGDINPLYRVFFRHSSSVFRDAVLYP